MAGHSFHQTNGNRKAKLRWAVVVSLIVCAVVFALRGRGSAAAPPALHETSGTSLPATMATPGPRSLATAAVAARPPAAMSTLASPPPTPTAEEQQERERAIGESVRRFQFEAMPVLDGCLGAMPGLRRPEMVIVTFRRDEKTPGDSDTDRFVAADLQVPPQHAGLIDPTGPVGRCLQGLKGRPVSIAAGNAPAGNEFRQVLTLLLPE